MLVCSIFLLYLVVITLTSLTSLCSSRQVKEAQLAFAAEAVAARDSGQVSSIRGDFPVTFIPPDKSWMTDQFDPAFLARRQAELDAYFQRVVDWAAGLHVASRPAEGVGVLEGSCFPSARGFFSPSVNSGADAGGSTQPQVQMVSAGVEDKEDDDDSI